MSDIVRRFDHCPRCGKRISPPSAFLLGRHLRYACPKREQP